MFDICTTNVHFDSHMSVWLPMNTYVLGDLTKPAITIAGVNRFLLKFGILFALKTLHVVTKFC